jgi:hypothetical protein
MFSSNGLAGLRPASFILFHGPIEIRSDFSALNAASLTSEQRLEIGQPHVVRPSIGIDLYVVAAMIIRAVDQQAANAHLAHFT